MKNSFLKSWLKTLLQIKICKVKVEWLRVHSVIKCWNSLRYQDNKSLNQRMIKRYYWICKERKRKKKNMIILWRVRDKKRIKIIMDNIILWMNKIWDRKRMRKRCWMKRRLEKGIIICWVS